MFVKLKLQLFAEEKVQTVLDDNYEDVPVEDAEVVDEEDSEDVEEVEDEEPGESEVEEETDDEEDVEEEEEIEVEQNKPTFDKKQQKELDRIVKTRLERQEGKLLKDLRQAAGTEIEMSEVSQAATLWGLLKTNPELSKAIDQVIDQHLREGKAIAPEANIKSNKEAELEVKEAILDLKLSDKTFNKHADKILAWAENQGFEVANKKSLQLAFMAWKGSQEKIIETTKKVSEQKKQATKQAVKQKAKVQSGKSSKAKGKVDYARLSDADVLATEGLSLFTDD